MSQVKSSSKKCICKSRESLPVRIYDHITGTRFSTAHKVKAGIILMVCGVSVSMAGHEINTFFAFMGDGIGYLLHGSGCMPILEYLHTQLTKTNNS